MKKTNTQKGITLIALIITIIVLLILAVVAIGAVQNNGIIQHAKNAKSEYQSAQNNEQTTLDSYLDKIDASVVKKPTSITLTGESTVAVRKTITLTVESDVGTISAEDIKWTSSNETAATVENGVVTGKSSNPDEYLTTTITATYIADESIVATKEIEVCGRVCDDCDGNIVVFMCAECNVSYYRDSLVLSDCDYCYFCSSCGDYVTPESDSLNVCPDCGTSSVYLDTLESTATISCPVGHELGESVILDNLEWECTDYVWIKVCESCDGMGELYD